MPRIGLISDTHGRVRRAALRALQGCTAVLHAGDVGGPGVLDALREVAPVHAVRGNVDDPHQPDLADHVELTIDGCRVHVVHGHQWGSPTPERLAAAIDADVVVFGHTHRALVQSVGHTLVVNPGSAGPARFGLPVTVAVLEVRSGRAQATVVDLDPSDDERTWG